ncbi:negative regulator of DNA transposition [Phyllosticta citribraziliensis]|uniref:Negative regulator of DNA transposition n=1 Tax=Phyllosticta citribraziliensis TaxID=989973 RepID=A0ABR1M3L8_9PEZI
MAGFTAITSRPSAAATASAPQTNEPPPKHTTQSLPEVEQAFAEHPDLKKRVYSAIDENPTHKPLFSSISSYILQLHNRSATVNGAASSDEPAAKKRKLEEQQQQQQQAARANGAGAGSWADANAPADLTVPDVSFSIPARKKFQLEVVGKGPGAGIRAVGAGGAVEFGVGFADVDQIFCLPIPEKAKRQWNFIVIPKNNDGVMTAAEDADVKEQIVWTFAEPSNKEVEAGAEAGPEPTAARLDQYLKSHGKRVVFPTKAEFQSAIPQAHRKGEPGSHVKAFKGSKEGFLFFTREGIIFGFKKPLMYFSFASIDSISYTSVLQRTFNLNITVYNPASADPKPQEIEFSMIDQADYSGIDSYIKKHGLNDASMAVQRRAQRYNVNAPTQVKGEDGEDAGAADEEEDGVTELEKAQMMLEDQEDEEEEDYDPGSDGDSEGEGSSSEEEEYDDDDDGSQERDEDGNILQDELGSEAEDVEMSDEE